MNQTYHVWLFNPLLSCGVAVVEAEAFPSVRHLLAPGHQTHSPQMQPLELASGHCHCLENEGGESPVGFVTGGQ